MIAMIFFEKMLGLKIETLGNLGNIFDCFVLVGNDVEVLDEFALYLEKMDKTVYICSEIGEVVQLITKDVKSRIS
ncbi:hypothetical protein [Sphingobacterium sp. HMA12]|uniref:hypothetical protein n=1 Tax=Sphingobacterium sp. HMA12 TaxID=2050894 RepID=UPI000CEA00D1|nr:hypothetical protein [Sphingobacterium sp. HMA12]